MKLFKFEGFKLQISEEALAIKAFRDLWERDKSVAKEKAIQELGFLYFFCDPRSDYMFLIDDDERMDVIKKQEGLPDKWKPDDKLKKAMDVYKYLTTTSSSLLLQDTRELLDKLRIQMKNVDFMQTDDKGRLIYPTDVVTKIVKQIPSLIKELNEAEKTVNAEVEENAKMRGNGVKKILEDGFNFS